MFKKKLYVINFGLDNKNQSVRLVTIYMFLNKKNVFQTN